MFKLTRFGLNSSQSLQILSVGRSNFVQQDIRTLFNVKPSSKQTAPSMIIRTYQIQPLVYARRPVRRTQVDVEEQTQQGTEQTGLSNRTGTQGVYEQKRETQQEYAPYSDAESTEQAITPDVKTHLTKVYGTMTAGLGMAAAGAVAGGMAPGLALVGMIGSLVGVISLMFIDKAKVSLRQNLFLGIGGLMGMGIGPLVAASAPGVVFAAALGTSAIFGGFTLAALRAKRKSMLLLGGPLMGGIFMLLGCSLAGFLLPMIGITSPALLGALYNINLYGGLAIFSLFISYDTQRMIEDYKEGDTDHVSPALSMFLNVMNIFIRLLQIFRGQN